MKEERMKKIITNWHFDFNNLHGDWEKGKVNDGTMLNFMANLCFYFLRELVDDSLATKK